MKKAKEPRALYEVRKWKKEVAKEASKLHGQKLADFYNKSMKMIKKPRKAA